MKKVISFSLWGDSPFYNVGALKNVELAKKYYEDWICRFYIDSSTPKDIVKQLESNDNVETIMMDTLDNNCNNMLWRIYPISDPDVDVMISRDADCRITEREAFAVNEWILSEKTIHIMRDHPMHTEPMMGGMWGCRTKQLFLKIKHEINASDDIDMKNIIDLWMQKAETEIFHGQECYVDQKFLREFIYKLFWNDSLIHDSFPMHNCWSGRQEGNRVRTREMSIGFPTARLTWDDFIGQVFYEDESANEESSKYLKEEYHRINLDYSIENIQ